MKVVYFGTPRFAAEVLQFLINNGINVVAVVTKPDKPKGRSSQLVATPVKTVAEAHHIPVMQPTLVSAEENIPLLQKYEADLFVVVAYGEIIKQHLLDMPKIACINLHASLLPKYRGAAPIQRAIMHGEAESGVTIMHMVKKMDAGDMIAVAKVAIGQSMTAGELEQELCREGSQLLLDTLHQFEKGVAQRTPQDHSLLTMAPKIELEDCEIDWKGSAGAIHNLIRGVTPFPGAWCWVMLKGEKKRLRILSSEVALSSNQETGIFVPCGSGQLTLLRVQLEGKKPMSSEEFLRGYSKEQLQFI